MATTFADLITVVIADDHPIVRAGLKSMIEDARDIRVIGEAGDGEEALALILELKPHVAVLDIELPQMNGLDVLRAVRAREIPALCIILTLFDDKEMFNRAVDLGAAGYILKESAPADIVRGIRRVAEGDLFLGASSSAHSSTATAGRGNAVVAIERLTTAERHILRMIADDRSTKEIATELRISKRTVDHHRANICSKLGINGNFALIRFAVEHQRIC